MNPYLELFKDYIRENPINYGSDHFDSIFEMFYWHYTEMNPNVSERVWALCRQKEVVCQKLTTAELDELSTITWQIFGETEKIAFRSGLRVGMQCMAELLSPDADLPAAAKAQ